MLLWVYITAYKTPLGLSPYRIIYGKACRLPIELQHKGFWDIKHFNFNLTSVGQARMLQLNKLEDHMLFTYDNVELYTNKIKKWHKRKFQKRELAEGERVLLFNSRLKLFPGKHKSIWTSLFKLLKIYPHGAVDLLNEKIGEEYKVNG